MPQFHRANPITGDVASSADAMSVAEAGAIVDDANRAFVDWSQQGPTLRRILLLKAADSLVERSPQFIDAMANETGATKAWASFNVQLAASMIREAASLTTQIVGSVIPSDKPGCLAMLMREPVGVILGIAPWNAPVILGVRAIATALACGNSVVLKASEICPRTHQLIAEAFEAAGFPSGVLGVVTNAPEDAKLIVDSLIDNPVIQRINFTGSTRVGRQIALRAAQNLKPCLLELGGKAPLIVLDDANLEEAAKAAAFGAYFNSGQICMSTERIIVVDSVADRFVELLTAKARTLSAGDPREARTPLGAMVDMKNVERVNDLIADAVEKGANVLAGGRSNGIFFSATLLDHVTKAMKIFRDESFGPVAAIIRISEEAEAIQIANDTEYGLAGSVFTGDVARGLKVARQVRTGIFHINGPTVHDESQMPFGGLKNSGYGRFGGQPGIDSFTEVRWITIETNPGKYPI